MQYTPLCEYKRNNKTIVTIRIQIIFSRKLNCDTYFVQFYLKDNLVLKKIQHIHILHIILFWHLDNIMTIEFIMMYRKKKKKTTTENSSTNYYCPIQFITRLEWWQKIEHNIETNSVWERVQ